VDLLFPSRHEFLEAVKGLNKGIVKNITSHHRLCADVLLHSAFRYVNMIMCCKWKHL